MNDSIDMICLLTVSQFHPGLPRVSQAVMSHKNKNTLGWESKAITHRRIQPHSP